MTLRRYFDANATVPPLPKVVEAVTRAMQEDWGNPTSTHREGQRARHKLEEARREIAASLGVPADELIFCASATEALHLLVRGLRPSLGDCPVALHPGEHSACLNPFQDWPRRSWLPELPDACAVLAQMAASNETGIRFTMPQWPGAIRIKDCAQAWGKVPVDLSDCEAAVFSGHKIGAPRGVALLWMKAGLPWVPVLEGPQERRRRGGTEDLPAVLGLLEAVRALPERILANAALEALRDAFESEFLSGGIACEVLGKMQPRLPNTSSLMFPGRRGETLHMALDMAGFAVSTGSACHSGSVEPSHAVMALGYTREEARSVLRVSMLPGTLATDVEALAEALQRILRR